MIKIKTGIGFDVHAFAKERRLIIGGVNIPYEYGLDGHSDADVLAHAITDAIIGVTLGKDIGNIFPDTDKTFKNADSIELLKTALAMTENAGYTVDSIDATIIAQTPKMAPFIPEMRRILSDAMKLPYEDVTIKATTTEKLGFTGRKEGIAAMAVATVLKAPMQEI